jgi:hypothetical protein
MSILPHQSAINLSENFYFNPGSAVPDEDSVFVSGNSGIGLVTFTPSMLSYNLNPVPITYIAPDDGVLVVTADCYFGRNSPSVNGNTFTLTVTDGVYTNSNQTSINTTGSVSRSVAVVFTRPVAKNESVTFNIIASVVNANTGTETVSGGAFQALYSPNP